MKLLSLFSGAGGLDLGLEAAGFENVGCVERDRDSLETLKANTDWPLAKEGDVEKTTPEEVLADFGLKSGEISLLAGGPPCQPFSKSGQWVTGTTARMSDPRAATLRFFMDMVATALPEVMLLENVKGLTSNPRPGTHEEQALDVLRFELDRINVEAGTAYVPTVLHLDAADYGVPQRRERVFVIAHRGGRVLKSPERTHGPKRDTQEFGSERWTTAWDAIGDLEGIAREAGLETTGRWANLLPSIPEGDNYLFHTSRGQGLPLFGWRTKYWSFLLKLAKNRPSWTIQAQPGPATGPFHWDSRKLSIRELARLQTFPDSHSFTGSYQSARKQIGNAVPAALAEVLGYSVRAQLLQQPSQAALKLVPDQRDDCPPPGVPDRVPEEFTHLIGNHDEHPGTGLGPSASERTPRSQVQAPRPKL